VNTFRILIYFMALILGTAANAADNPAPNLTSDERALVDFTNRERAKQGLPPLSVNEQLMAAARGHSANMASQKLLAHVLDAKSEEDRIKELGYRYFEIGENVAWNDPDPKAAVDAWMQSSPHRANILRKDFTEIGVGIARDERGQPYYTQDFGRPISAGANAQARFTIANESDGDILVTMGTSGNASMLAPGQKGMFSMAGMGKLPPVKVQVGDQTRDLNAADGAHYVIRGNDGAINVSTGNQDKEAR